MGSDTDVTIMSLTERIRSEFVEASDLVITVQEGMRFWVIDAETCARVLNDLYEMGFLVKRPDGQYLRRHAA